MLSKDFKEFIELLNENRVKYLVVGGYAVALNGHPRYTKDLQFEECYKLRVQVEIQGLQITLIDIENLKKNKRAAGRLQDLADVENLE